MFSFPGQAQVDRLEDFRDKINSNEVLKTSEYACNYQFLHPSYADQIHMSIQIKLHSLIIQHARIMKFNKRTV